MISLNHFPNLTRPASSASTNGEQIEIYKDTGKIIYT